MTRSAETALFCLAIIPTCRAAWGTSPPRPRRTTSSTINDDLIACTRPAPSPTSTALKFRPAAMAEILPLLYAHRTPRDEASSIDGYDACDEFPSTSLDVDHDNDDGNVDRSSSSSSSSSSTIDRKGGGGNDGDGGTMTKRILDLAVPALISLAIDPLMTIADTAFVGRYSEPNDPYPLAGLGTSASLLVFSFYVFNFLATSTAPLVARRRASGDEYGARMVGGQALSLAMLLGTSLTFVLLLYRAPLLRVMGTSVTGPEADAYAMQFLTVRALAAPAVLLCSASNGVMRGYLDARTPTLILLGSNAVNLALDVILVAIMGMGPRGAGIATTVAEWIAALCFLGVLGGKLPTAPSGGGEDGTRRDVVIRRSDALDDQRDNNYDGCVVVLPTVTPLLDLPAWEDVRPLVVASSAVFLRSIVLQVAMSSAAAMAARSTPNDGTIAVTSGASASVAAHQVALQLWLLCSFLCDALATASQALVADGKGRNDADDVRAISRTVFNWGLALGLTLSTCLWVGTASGFLIEFFTSDDVTQKELGKLLTIVILAQPLNSFVFAADGVLQGAGEFTYQAKSMALSVISAFAMFALLEYSSFGLECLTGGDKDTLVNVWCALITLQAMRGITSFVKVVEKTGPIDLFGKKAPS
ncbi:hypothetical protein ACHAXA_008129 [Cyclostephanos tholiformis]|uniref:Multidrug and toxic compound extrusion protein n=1 Tax=Cyclostephanos tholiformis TaxID=382380 RepID=A0ABD3SEN9_9STRA